MAETRATTLATLARLRQLAANQAKRALAQALTAEHNAAQAHATATTRLAQELAAPPTDAAHPLAGSLAAWLPAAQAQIATAANTVRDAADQAAAARADLAQAVLGTQATSLPLGVYANAFPPQPADAQANAGLDPIRDDLTPAGYLRFAEEWQARGASMVGGCCGIGPEHIAALSAAKACAHR